MRVTVIHNIGDLSTDLAGIAKRVQPDMAKVVRKNVNAGTRLAKANARAAAGPHGTNYYKRISGEMTGPLEGEFGPHDGGTPVGAGYRHGGVNMDLPNAADVIGPKFADDVDDAVDGWFW